MQYLHDAEIHRGRTNASARKRQPCKPGMSSIRVCFRIFVPELVLVVFAQQFEGTFKECRPITVGDELVVVGETRGTLFAARSGGRPCRDRFELGGEDQVFEVGIRGKRRLVFILAAGHFGSPPA